MEMRLFNKKKPSEIQELLKTRLRSFASQKPLQNFWKKFYQKRFAKIRFAERTCAKKGNLFPSGKNFTYAEANFFSSQTLRKFEEFWN